MKLLLLFALCCSALAEDTLRSLKPGEQAPQSFDALWSEFDPRKDPLDVEVLHEYEEDGVVVKVIRYCVGTFKGQKSMVAAVYGYPKGAENLPALVNAHGGGQYADARAVVSNAKRGYATLTVSWAGRIASKGYGVNPSVVKLFWDGKKDDPKYRVITDWGAIDGYHAPCRHPRSASARIAPHELTLDEVDSPRNSLWFLATMATRRGITFLEQQPQVNPDKIGMYGHSMGGKITVLTAASDKRLKVAVPTCGGISNNENSSALYNATLGDIVNLQHITCPIKFLSPANDFHGNFFDIPQAFDLVQSEDVRVTAAPHHNHQDTGQYTIAGFEFIDHYLKGAPALPQSPEISVSLEAGKGAVATVSFEERANVKSVDVFYTQQGPTEKVNGKAANPRFKFWHHAKPVKVDGVWTVTLPLNNPSASLTAYANVEYAFAQPESATSYYYSMFTTDSMVISSVPQMYTAEQVQAAALPATLPATTEIENFGPGWERGWFTYQPEQSWAIKTNKLYNPVWKAPDTQNSKLSLQVKTEQPNTLVIRLDDYVASQELPGGEAAQEVALNPSDFQNAKGELMASWLGASQLEIAPYISVRSRFNHNGIVKSEKLERGTRNWKGSAPEFISLRWQ